jgi:NTE family protein
MSRRATGRLRPGALLGLALLASAAVAAEPVRPKVCLVLSGGGARGIPHIGVLKVLEELRVPVDCIVGTSAGAIIGGAYASGASPAEIERMISGADWDHLLTDQPARIDRSVYTKEVERAKIGGAEAGLRGRALALPRGVLIGQHLQFFLQSLVAPATRGSFDGLPIQYRALATDFETGRLVVLDHGGLAESIRASMSVPGAFAPVEIDGAMLVDGGLVRNLGIDVARDLGAEIIIAVNVGSPLLRRAELDSLFGAAEQTLNILVEQNVDVSLAALGPEDVLITPSLGTLSPSDFAHGAEFIPAGELATRRAARQLSALAVSEAEYAAWRAGQRRPRLAPHYDRVVVDTSGLSRVSPRSIRALVGDSPDPNKVDATIDTLLGTDDFEVVQGEVRPGADGTTLVLRPVEKPWGGDYLRAGAKLTANFEGLSAFTLYADQRMTWLNSSGLEWRNRASIGQFDSIATELRQPFGAARTFFVAPRIAAADELRDIYVGTDPLESYRRRELRVGVDLGVRFGNLGEFKAGVEGGGIGAARTVGPRILPDAHTRIGDIHASWVFDGLDSPDFPRRGFLFSGEAQYARRMFAGTEEWKRLTVDAQQAFGTDASSVLLAARFQSALDTVLPYYEQFTAGGFLDLSGLRPDQVLSGKIELVRLIYRHRVASFSALLPAVHAGLSLENAAVGAQQNGQRSQQLHAGSVFLQGDSALGPLYFGLGVAEGGFVSVYLLIGRP